MFERWRPASGSLSRLADTHGQNAWGRRLTNSNPPRLLEDIQSQPESLAAILSYQLGSGYAALVRAAGSLRAATRVVITGMGASMCASIPFEYRLCSVGIDATVVESGELLHHPRPLLRDTVVVVVSRSGESVEIAKLLPVLRGTCTTIGVTNDPESSLARGADHVLHIRSLPDEMVAIQTYTGTLLVLALVAAAVADELPAAASEARAALDLQRSFIREGVERLTRWDEFLESGAPIYLLARGPSSSSAFEGALLFNETAKVPAIGMTAASFRHGPVELVDGNFAGLIFAPADGTRMLNLALAEDLVRFGGRVRVIGPPHPDHAGLEWCEIPEVPAFLAPLFEAIPVQLAALRLAQLRGIAVGQFRYAPQVSRDEATFAPRG
jgi:glucosamine--fructose-6-phosphate aminotransferase (isomerizing)